MIKITETVVTSLFILLSSPVQIVCQDLPDLLQDITNDVPAYEFSLTGTLNGLLKKWHKVTLGFEGPDTNETADPNPFTDYRLDVTLSHETSGKSYLVPGYYGADGNAANTGSTSGSAWFAHFAPDEEGEWMFIANFTMGSNVAQNGGGTSAGFFDGEMGFFNVSATNATGRDLRGKGYLQYVGERYPVFAETGERFIVLGPDSPENLLAYEDFDNTLDLGYLKNWEPHIQDFQPADPTWNNGKGKGLIGAVNYLSAQEMNAFSFLTMNIGGDDKSVYPYISDQPEDRQRMDVSKLAQWEVVFEHADHMGMLLHVKTQEIENERLLDDGMLGPERKLYYRELIARFGHHLALNWDLGEENNNTISERETFSAFLKETDPYDHPIHTYAVVKPQLNVYQDLLGYPDIDGASVQGEASETFKDTLTLVRESSAAGHPWIVSSSRQGSPERGVVPDRVDAAHNSVRQDAIYGNIFGEGAGVQFYFGSMFENSDLTCQDFRSRESLWRQARIALEFFSKNNIPYGNMTNANELVVGSNFVLKDETAELVVVYFKQGNSRGRRKVIVDLTGYPSRFYKAAWYDVRNGGDLKQYTCKNHVYRSDKKPMIFRRPRHSTEDWILVLRCDNCQ